MWDVVYDFKRLAERNRDGSYMTQYQRKTMLMQFGNQLVALGWRQMRATDFKGRHVHALMKLWREQAINDSTLANRLAVLRWLCEKLDRASVLPRTNAAFGLTPRRRVATVSKAVELGEAILAQVDDPYVQMSLQLQAAFGLRRKECLLIQPWQADQGEVLALQGSWCKNGRARTIPAQNWPAQREVLEQAKQLVRFKSSSLIPTDLKYFQQRNRYDTWARTLGLEPLHGLRHSFAQKRYEQLAGMRCPVQGGPTRETMTAEERQRDRAARQQVSAELGHGRLSVVGMYCGL